MGETCNNLVTKLATSSIVEQDDNISRKKAIINVASIAKVLAKSDKQKALCGRILFMLERMPTTDPTLEELQKEVDYWHELSNSYEQTIVRLTEAASRQPQITECEHCLAYDPFDNGVDGFCRKMGKVMCVSDFCSYAERKGDG